MLKDGVVLAVVLLIVAGALFLWWTQASPTHYGSPVADTQVQPVEPPKPAPVLVKARLKAKPEPVIERAELAPAVEPVVVAASAPVVRRDPLPFPVVEQILTGAHARI